MDGEAPKQKQKSYTVREKREAVLRMSAVGVEKAARELNVARGTEHGWWKQADELLLFTGHATSKTLKGQGRKGKFPDVPSVVTYMKDMRRKEQALTTKGMMEFMYQIETDWVETFLEKNASELLALQRLCERLANRYFLWYFTFIM
eukprot:jgi/Phyca11/103745/e_gw1.8.838.1